MKTRIKICGITNREDARAAVRLGADALGFMFYAQSPRQVSFATAAAIIAELPPLVATVGVFVDPTTEFVQEAMARTGINTLQFHGNEPPEFCAQFPLKAIRAFRLRDRASLAGLPAYATSAWLLDSYVPGVLGGSGQTFNWDLATEAVGMGRPVLLAGGLTPENIAEAIACVRPFGVDVSSGVESAPGKKDPAKMRLFIERAWGARGSAASQPIAAD